MSKADKLFIDHWKAEARRQKGEKEVVLKDCKWFMELLGAGFLVRDISEDARPDYYPRMLMFTKRLAEVSEHIKEAETEAART